MSFLRLSVLILWAAALSACGGGEEAAKPEEKTGEKATLQISDEEKGPVSVNVSKEGVEVKSAEGAMSVDAGKEVKIPDDFPKDVFLLPDAKLSAAAKMGESHTLTLMADDDMDKAAARMKEGLEKEGWKETSSLGVPNVAAIREYKKDDRTVSLNITPKDGKTVVMVLLDTKKE